MNTAGTYRKLTAQEERDLALQRIDLGPKAWKESEARRTLIECNIPWARRVAWRYGGARHKDDNRGVALMALCKAVDTFDPDRGRMTTYVKKAVVQHLFRSMKELESAIHVPESIQDYLRALDRGGPAVPRRPGMEALTGDARRAMRVVSLERPTPPGLRKHPGKYERWLDLLVARPEDGEEPGPRPTHPDAARAVEAIDRLPAHLAATVRDFHLSDGPAMSLDEVARLHGITKSAVCYRLTVAYRKLREILTVPETMTT